MKNLRAKAFIVIGLPVAMFVDVLAAVCHGLKEFVSEVRYEWSREVASAKRIWSEL